MEERDGVRRSLASGSGLVAKTKKTLLKVSRPLAFSPASAAVERK
jgi:hypothetical protein